MSTRRIWLIAFLVAALLYGATADYGPQWQDSGWQQWRILTGEIDHPAGLVVTHPLQFWLGRLFLILPFGHPAGRSTLVSVLGGAIAIANLAAFGWIVTRRLSAAAIPAIALMLSHTFWQHATHTESYTLVAAVLTFEWICVAMRCLGGSRWWLVAAMAANGLGVANHLLAGLSTPILLGVWGWEIRRKSRAASASVESRVSPATAGAEPDRYEVGAARFVNDSKITAPKPTNTAIPKYLCQANRSRIASVLNSGSIASSMVAITPRPAQSVNQVIQSRGVARPVLVRLHKIAHATKPTMKTGVAEE